jgi:transposase-like protein
MRKFYPEQEIEAIRMYRAGSSMNSVAAHFGVSRPAIRALLRRHEEPLRPRNPPRPSRPREVVEGEVVKLRLEGIPVRNIATRVGATSTTVSEILIQRGLHTRLKRGENSTARRRFKPEQDQDLAQEYLNGVSITKLAQNYGCYPILVRNALLRVGVQMRRRGGNISPFATDPVFREKIRALWEQGATQTIIGKILGCSQAVVSRLLVRHFGIRCKPGGSRHGAWKGGRILDPHGYVRVLLSHDHHYTSMRTANGYVLEHRLRMAEYLGRALLKNEDIHHINGDKTDNRIENLQLRIGSHGSRVHYKCADCGSIRLVPVEV